MSEVGVIDPVVWNDLCQLQTDADPNIVAELIDLFFHVTPELIDGMRAAIAASDASRLEQIAHRCAGSSANLGATRLATLCHTLEGLARARTMAGTQESLATIEAEYARVVVALVEARHAAPSFT